MLNGESLFFSLSDSYALFFFYIHGINYKLHEEKGRESLERLLEYIFS